MKWIKASEKLPPTSGMYFIKHIESGKIGISRFKNKIGKQSLFYRSPKKIEWLDESTSEPIEQK